MRVAKSTHTEADTQITPDDFYRFACDVKTRKTPKEPTEGSVERQPQVCKETVPHNQALRLHTKPTILSLKARHRTCLFFDTETSSLYKPAIVQLAYVLVKDQTVVEYDKIWQRPPGIYMDHAAVAIHGISKRRSDSGLAPSPQIKQFYTLVQEVLASGGRVIAHNARFDARAFNFTANALKLNCKIDAERLFCTMKRTAHISTLTTAKGTRKQLKNSELYEHMLGGPPSWANLHNALDDVYVTLFSYQAALEREVFGP